MKKLWAAIFLAAMIFGVSARAGQLSSNFDVAFYGYVKVDTIYLDAKADGLDYTVWVPPANLSDGTNPAGHGLVKNGDDPAFGITARQTRFGFIVKGPRFGNDGQVLGKIEGDFYGSTYGYQTDSWENKGNLALRIAEIELKTKNWDLLVGNDWMIVSPLFPHVSNYTYQMYIGDPGYRIPQIRFTGYMLDSKLQFQVAADDKIGLGSTDPNDYNDIDSGRNSGAPDVQAGIVWDSQANGKPFKLGVTGMYGRVVLDDQYNHGIPSYMVNLHWMLPFTKWFSLNGEYYWGENLGSGYYGGAQGKGWVQVSNGNFEALRDAGGWGELEFGPLKNFYVYAGYTEDQPDNSQLKNAVAINSNSKLIPWQAITRNQSYYASVHYWLVPKVADISLEWMQIDTTYGLARPGHNGEPATDSRWDDGMANRYTLSFWLFF